MKMKKIEVVAAIINHKNKKERDIMEKKEIKLMSQLGLSNPYYAE